MDPKIIVEGDLKFRGTRKWRHRWAICTRLSPVADCLHLQLYRNQKEKIKTGLTKASLSLEKFIGLEGGFTLDKESNTLALICQDMVLLLAFNTRETLLHWQTIIRTHLPQEHQYPVEIVQFPSKSSRLTIGPSRLHIRDGCFALVSGNPPRLSGLWQLPDLRRYGVLNGKFCFEGGSSCGKGEGLHVLQTLQTGELMKAFQLASIGNLQPKRKLSTIKRDKCNNNNNLSDRISFCSSSSHSSGTSSISSGNGSYQSSLEYLTPRPSISGHHHHHNNHQRGHSHNHHHHHHHPHHYGENGDHLGTGECSNCSTNSGLMLFNGCGGGDDVDGGASPSLCSCLSESNLTTTTLDATTPTPTTPTIGSNNHRNHHHHHHHLHETFDCESTTSSTNTLKRTTYNSSQGSDSGSNAINVDPRVLHKLITGHYQIPKSLLSNQGKNLRIDSEEDKINLINNLEMYDVPRKFQQIHLNNNLTDLKQSIDCRGGGGGVNCSTNDLNNNITKKSNVINNGLTFNSTNCLVDGDKILKVNCHGDGGGDEMITIITDSMIKSIGCNSNSLESTTTIELQSLNVNNDQKTGDINGKLLVNCCDQINQPVGQQFKPMVSNNSNGLTSINKQTNRLNESQLKSNSDQNQTNCCLNNPTINSTNNYVNLDFARSLKFYQNVGLLKKQLNSTINSSPAIIKPAANLPEVKQLTPATCNNVNQLDCENVNQQQNLIAVNYNLMVNKSTDNKDDYLEMIPLLISDDCRSESDLSDHNNQSEIINQHYLDYFHHYHHHNQQLTITTTNNQNDSNIFFDIPKDHQSINNQNNNTSASSSSSSSTNHNQQTKLTLINPLSRSLNDLRKKLWSRLKSIDYPPQQLPRNQFNQLSLSSSSCPSSPQRLSLSTNHHNQPILSAHGKQNDEQLIFSLPTPPPPPPPPLSYLLACRLNKSMESLLTLNGDQLTNVHLNCTTGTLNHDDLTSSDEDIYHASQIRVTSSSPFDCRPMSPSEIKRSTSLPNGQSATINDKFNLYPINNHHQQQLLSSTINYQLKSKSEKCNNQLNHDDNDLINSNNSTLNDLNKSTTNCNNQNGSTILIKPS